MLVHAYLFSYLNQSCQIQSICLMITLLTISAITLISISAFYGIPFRRNIFVKYKLISNWFFLENFRGRASLRNELANFIIQHLSKLSLYVYPKKILVNLFTCQEIIYYIISLQFYWYSLMQTFTNVDLSWMVSPN